MAKLPANWVASDGYSSTNATNTGVIRLEQDGVTERLEQDGVTVRTLNETVVIPKELTEWDQL